MIPARAVAPSEGVLKAMSMTKLKMSAAFLAAVCAVTPSGAWHRGPADEKARPPGEQRKEAGQPKDGTIVKGKLAGVDADNNSVTVTISSFDRKTGKGSETNKSFTLAKDARILQDDAAAKLTELKKGYPVTVKLDRTTAVSVSVDGGTAQGEFRSANAERNTITVIAGRNLSRRVYHLIKDTKVLGDDGKPIRVQDLKAGTILRLTLSVEDEHTAIRIQTLPDPEKRKR
jgi:hypothetical protein